ncbi:MAG: hypothetical protein IJ157_00750 [Clostridia bacterium]|nr:hypothetical protein [Clostridia bacterium]
MPTLEMIRQAVGKTATEYPVKRVEFSENPTAFLQICGFRETLCELLYMDVDIVKLPRRENDGLHIGRTVHLYGA